MPSFETVLIEARAGRYEIVQADQLLLAVPTPVFERYESDDVFPPGWDCRALSHPVRRLFWNPQSAEFLMAGLEAHPARTVESSGSTAYRSYLQGFWLPQPPVLLLRPYWNPPAPMEPFDEAARLESLRVQLRFLEILRRLRPPPGWTTILNATDPYLEALGVSASGGGRDPEAVWELSLTPPVRLESSTASQILEILATDHVGRALPLLRGPTLAGVHTLSLTTLHATQALLDREGVAHQKGPFRPH